VFVNDYSPMKDDGYDRYQETVLEILTKNGLEPILFPYAYHKCPQMTEEEFYAKYPFADDMNPGVGYYVNYLSLDGLILVPSFGFEEDGAVVGILRKYHPDRDVIQIDCFDLAMLGGLVHCVTWEL